MYVCVYIYYIQNLKKNYEIYLQNRNREWTYGYQGAKMEE